MTVTRDTASGLFFPANAAEATALYAGTGIANPILIYNLQETSGTTVTDAVSAINGTVTGGTLNTPVSGYTRVGVKLGSTPNTTATIHPGVVTALPNIGSASMMSLTEVLMPTLTSGFTTTMSVSTLGPTYDFQLAADCIFDATLITKLLGDTAGGGGGTNTVAGTHNESGAIALIVQWNNTAGTAAIQTPNETIVPTAHLAGTLSGQGFWLGGDNSQTWESAGGTYLHHMVWGSSGAEHTATQRASVLSLRTTGPIASIALSPSSVTLTSAGFTQQLTATATYSNTPSASTAVVTSSSTGQWTTGYTSSNTAVATVSGTGLITATGNGTATITCTCNGISQTVTVTVGGAVTLVSVAVAPSTASVTSGSTVSLVATGTYSDASTQNLTATATWTTSSGAVATVTLGVVTGVAAGSATITATSGGIAGTASITVTLTVPSPVVGVDVPDHVAAAISRLCQQFKNQPNIAALLTALVAPMQGIENALWQLLTQRTLTTSIGAQLDALGKLVGQPRNGLSDSDYRRYIAARISVNRSDGIVEDLIAVSRSVLNNSAALINVFPQGTATVIVQIKSIAVSFALGTILSGLLDQAAAAGVRLLLEASTALPAATFTFDTGPGFDVGVLAYAID